LKEGVLVKQCQSSRANRKFYLFSDLLVYAKIVPGTGVFTCERYLLSEKMLLTKVHLEDRADDEEKDPPVRCSFVIQSGHKAFAVFAESNEAKCDWLLAVSNATAQILAEEEVKEETTAARQSSGGPPAPVLEVPSWQDDTGITQCPLCNAKFNSLLLRKYHCRLCGNVACGSCTEGRVVVAAWGDDQLRVCRPCHGKERKGVAKVNVATVRRNRNLTGSLSNLMTLSRGSKHK
jgi:predicted nucleic acid-binding Zn ribbon protein